MATMSPRQLDEFLRTEPSLTADSGGHESPWEPSLGGHRVEPGFSFQRSLDEPNDNAPRMVSNEWRCLACEHNTSLALSDDRWMCDRCGSFDFYRVNQPTKKVTEHGTWMFVPYGEQAPSRRRRRRRHGGDPPGHHSEGFEQAESERPTVDPEVDPDAVDLPPQRPVLLQHSPQGRRSGVPHRDAGPLPDRASGTLTTTPKDPLLLALKKLVTSKDSEQDWSSRKGPEPGVRWRTGAPPTAPSWKYDPTDLRAFAKFKKKVRIWEIQMESFCSKKEQALLLYNALGGEAEQELEHVPVQQIYCNEGIETILNLLQTPMEQKVIYQKRKYLAEFENIRRWNGEVMRAYINRFRRTQRNLRAVGIDIGATYDDESLGSKLLDKAGLSVEQQRMLLVGTQQRLNFELIAEAMVLQFPDFRGAPPVQGREQKGAGKGKSSSSGSSTASTSFGSSSASSRQSSFHSRSSPFKKHGVMVTEHEDTPHNAEDGLEAIEEVEDQQDEEGAEDEGEDLPDQEEDPSENDPDVTACQLAEVLTVTARRLSGMTLGRKYSGSKKTPEELKKVTHCGACGEVGHWHTDSVCPLNGKGGQSQSNSKGGSTKPYRPNPSVGQKSSGRQQQKGVGKGGKASKPHSVSIVHHEHGHFEIEQPAEEFGSMFTVNMVSNVQAFEVHEVMHDSTPFLQYMILDSACQRTCCGTSWYEQHVSELLNKKLKPKEIKCADVFQFGKGKPVQAECRAYLPAGFDGKVTALIGTGVLQAQVPLLGSHELLDQLGCVISLPERVVHLSSLGVTVDIHKIGGHLAIRLWDFPKKNHPDDLEEVLPHQLQVWSKFSSPSLWQNPSPELILLESDSHGHDLAEPLGVKHRALVQELRSQTTSLTSGLPDVPATSSMDLPLAPGGQSHQELHERSHHAHVDSNSNGFHAQDLASGRHSPRDQEQGQSRCLLTSRLQTLRQSSRPVCSMRPMPTSLEVEREDRTVGAPSRWITKLLFAVAAIAGTFLQQHDGLPSRSFCQDQAQDKGPSQAEDASTMDYISSLAESATMVGPLRSSERGSAARGVADPGTTEPTGRGSQRLDAIRIPERGGLSSQQRTRSNDDGHRQVGEAERARDGGSGGRDNLSFHPGRRKRLNGNLKQSVKLMEQEVNIYESLTTTSSRPSPCIDVFELFAGSSKLSAMASKHGLNSLQPSDLTFGDDYRRPKTRTKIIQQVRKFRAWLMPMGVDCRLWNQFNINLNYNTPERRELLASLQESEQCLPDFAVQVAYEQEFNGRFFLLENPQNSTLWSLPKVQKLLSEPSVWSVVLDSGAWGGEIDGKMIKKPMRFVGNLPGLDEVLHRRLTPIQKMYCTPIEGSMTKRSEEYPDALCHAILSTLRSWIQEKEPQRFAHYDAFPVAVPSSDLSQWDKIVEQAVTTFERTNKRPYNVDPTSILGQEINNLLRMDTSRIQVVHTPTTRRLPTSMLLEITHRAALLQYNDGARNLELEHLPEIQFPKQRFHKGVQIAIFAYGIMRSEPEPVQQAADSDALPLADLPTDITFPGATNCNSETKKMIARLHLNLGHPSKQELLRMLAYHGPVSSTVVQAAQTLRCSTCLRTAPPQNARPAALPRYVGQFNDEIQIDIFWCRTLTSESYMVLGIVDRATGFHQADLLEFCAAEAHWMIGMVERRNALLRLTIEKLTDQFGVNTLEEVPTIITAALHAANSSTFTRGRTAYQAVFGRIPRMPDAVLSNETCLASSSDLARMDNPAAKADMVRAEAIKHIVDLNVSKQLRRALLRRTQNTRVPELQPGQQCAFWRWTKRGLKKRGGWVVSRFLSWDPSYPNKMAWVKTGTTTTLVTAEQLRPATGFEHWTPSREDIAALKQASTDFSQHMLEDQTGPAPVEGSTEQEMTQDHLALPPPPTPSMMVPATPIPTTQAAPSTPPHLTSIQQQTQHNTQQNIQATTTTNIQVHIDSPTHQQQQTSEELAQLQRFGDAPSESLRRGRSRTPTSKRTRLPILDSKRTPSDAPIAEQPATAEQPASAEQLPQQHEAEQTRGASEHATHTDTGAIAGQVSPTVSHSAPVTQEPATSRSPQEGADPILGEQQDRSPRDQALKRQASVDADLLQQEAQEDSHQQQTDRSRPRLEGHSNLMTLFIDDNAHISRMTGHEDGSQPLGYGPLSKVFFQAYATTQQRRHDIHPTNKQAEDSDSTQASEESSNDMTETDQQREQQGITRQERKQLDRELPWSQISQMPAAYIDKFLAAIEKEFNSWCEWESVLPLTEAEAQHVFKDKILSKRILRSRAAYRDKNCGQGELKAKCRVVALGHQDPDLYRISRDAPTPGRVSEHIIFAMAVAGKNCELLGTNHQWHPWLGDAQTAFLQGRQPDSERPHALYLKPPSDPLIHQTSTWQAPLYKVLGNIYGLPNAPYLWIEEIVKRLSSLGYIRHAFDVMMFLKYVKQQDGEKHLVSILIVYVDDFLGLFREDYDPQELFQAFKWGELKYLEENVSQTFKGKELLFQKNKKGRFILKITMKKFIDGLDTGALRKGRLGQKLDQNEKKEFRSVSGCLQWAASQCRPDISPLVSLSNQGEETTTSNLKDLYEGLDYLKDTSHLGLVIQDIPFDKNTVVMTYSDSSWNNAKRSGSQLGVLVCLARPHVSLLQSEVAIVDWKSGRSPRVCRSTLAAEASAADEGSDRSSYINHMISQIAYGGEPAHKIGARLSHLQATDAKSLYDSVTASNPSVSDRRSLVNIRAIQEHLTKNEFHWIPTSIMWADGLTKHDRKLRTKFSEWLQSPIATLREVGDPSKKNNTSEKIVH